MRARVVRKPNLRGVESPVRQATRRALNRVGQRGLTLTLRALSKATGVSQRKLREYVSQNRADFAELSTSIRILAHTFNVASVGAARQTRRGVSSGAWGKRRVYPSTFLIQGGRTAMKRVGKARLPIRPVWGPRITREFKRESVDTQLEHLVAQLMQPTLKHELNFALGRVGLRTL